MQPLKSIILLPIILVCLLAAPEGWAQVTLSGGKGQLRAMDADPVPAGQLYINGLYSLYLEKITTPIPVGAGVGQREELAVDHTLNVALTLGLSRTFELMLHAVPYQDNQRDLFGPIGDTQIGVKFHLPNRGSIFQSGLLGYVRLPTAPMHNIPYEGYSTDAFGWGLTGLASLDLRSSSLALPVKFIANIGYRDQDWGDRYFSADYDQLLFALGFKFPIRATLLYLETSGEVFVNQTDLLSLRQNLLRLSGGLRFLGPGQLVFDAAADIRLGNYTPSAAEMAVNPYLKRYADWKVLLGVTHRIQLFEPATEQDRARSERRAEEEKKNEEIRKQREQVNRELEELRKKIEKSQDQPPQ
ncbi:MAG TPA: hypothetical protein PKI81_02390 [bacterium]|nr:hypothetical protein [bacterium]HOC89735.1 hypothetical protein [bacterium]